VANKGAQGPTVSGLSRPAEEVQQRLDDGGEGSAPYCAVIGADPGAPQAQSPPAKRPAGLISELDIRKENARFVITIWATRDVFTRGVSFVLARLGGSSTILNQGYIADVETQRPGFWKRHNLGTKLLSAVAILGALSALRTYAGAIFEAADVGVAYTETGTLDVLEGDDLSPTIRVVARTRVSPVVVDQIPVALVAAGRAPIKLDDIDYRIVPPLAPGQSQELVVLGQAPAKSTSPDPDVYQLQPTILARSGLIRSRKSFQPHPRKVQVWSELYWTHQPKPSESCKSQCIFTGEINVGRSYPNGLRAQVSIDDAHLELDKLNVVGVSTTGSSVQGTPNSTGLWQTAALQAFKSYRYTVLLRERASATPQPFSGWSNVKLKVTVTE